MRQSQTYRRSSKGISIDPNSYDTYRTGVALRIQRRSKGRIKGIDAWQLAAIPAWFMWLFRKPRTWLKRKAVDRRMRRKMSRTNSGIGRNR